MGISLRCLRIHSEQNDVFGGGYFRHERDSGRPCPDGFSKSLVHKDVTERLSRLSPELWESVHAVLMKNRDERHLRGGEATREKYSRLRDSQM